MADRFKVKLQDILARDPESNALVLTDSGFHLHPGIVNVSRARKVQVKASYHIGTRILKRLREEVANLNEKHLELVKEYGEEILIEQGEEKKMVHTDRWQVVREKAHDYAQARTELLATEVDIDARTLRLTEFEGAEGVTAEDFAACAAFIIDE